MLILDLGGFPQTTGYRALSRVCNRIGAMVSVSLLLILTCQSTFADTPPHPQYETSRPVSGSNRIDRLVQADLKDLGIMPANVCNDDVYLRRVYLDLIGTLPTPKEQYQFKQNTSKNKRSEVIDQLMTRKEFADYWAMKWCDVLRVKAEFPINLWPNGVQAYYRWIHDAVRTNMPYDQFARELLTSSGSNFRTPQVNFYRALSGKKPEDIAAVVALTFMGKRYDRMAKAKKAHLEMLFSRVAFKGTSEWKEEIVYLNPAPVERMDITFPDGSKTILTTADDPRRAFAEWLIQPTNSDFTETIVNRIWYWLMGRGIVHEPDDRRADNPPSNPELLAYLENEFTANGYDLQKLMRLILTSQTYQQSSIPRSDSPKAGAHFAHYTIRPIEAEVLVDSLTWLFGQGERYSSQIPEPFTFIPDSHRAVTVADGSITSQFLEMFGRPSRDTGLAAERSTDPSAAQLLFMLNSQQIQKGLKSSWRLKMMIKEGKTRRLDAVTVIYRTILCRPPSAKELKTAQAYVKESKLMPRDAALDLAWALLNTKEFLYKH